MTVHLHRAVRTLAASIALAAVLTACGSDDADPAPATDDSDASTTAAAEEPAGGEVEIHGVMHGDVDGTTSANCVYVDDVELGRVYLNPIGEFEGLFRTVTDGSDPEHLTELVSTDGTVVIAKGADVVVAGVTEFSQPRCTQGDETEIAITSISAS